MFVKMKLRQRILLGYLAPLLLLLGAMGLVFFNSLFGMSYQVMMPIFARDILEVGSQGFGFLQSAVAVGAILGSLLAARLADARHRGLRSLAGAALFGLLIVAFSFSTWFPLSLVLMFLMGLTSAFYMITISTSLQILVPDQYRGRVMGLWSLSFSLPPLGGTLAGWLADYMGVPGAVSLGGLLVMAMAVATAVLVPRVRQLD